MADTIADRVEKLRLEWEKGHFPAVLEAFEWCALNGEPLPKWLVEPIVGALHLALTSGGSEGQGKTGGFLPRARRAWIDEGRWIAATSALSMRAILPALSHENADYEPTRAGAFKYASDQLKGTIAQGSPSAIEATYNRVQAAKRLD